MIAAVLLNWNNFDDTKSCIESLTSEQDQPLRIIVVDNNSQDGSGARLRSAVPGPHYILNDRNDGFARGCNIGIRHALTDPEVQQILLINNDATLKPGTLRYALARIRTNARVGLVGGKILTSPVSGRIWTAGGRLDLVRGQAVSRGVQELDVGQFEDPVKITFVTCALVLVTRAVFERVGLIPDEYFFGQEEWDFSLIARRAGFELWYEPQFVAYHAGDGAHSNADAAFIYNSYRNKLIFQHKHLPGLLWPVWFAVFRHLYSRFYARRHLARIHRSQDGAREYMLALDLAIKDHLRHGIATITEEDLIQVRRRLASLPSANASRI